MVDGVLYAWVRNLNLPAAPKGTGAGMMVSTDRGRTWEWVDWNWPELGYPVWMNAGRNYQAARDDYAYYLSPDGPSAYADYPQLVLGRVPVASIRDQARTSFLPDWPVPGVPRWGRFESRKPVFTDPNGCFRPNLVYNPGLKRYFLVMSSPYGKWKWWATDNPNRRAHLGIFDAPAPWGPWSVVDYIADSGAPENRFAPNIPVQVDQRRWNNLLSPLLLHPQRPVSIQCPTLHSETETAMMETRRSGMFVRDLCNRHGCHSLRVFRQRRLRRRGALGLSQPDVSDIGERVYVIERRPLGEWFMISWQKSPFTADGKFVPVDWDPGEKTGLSIPDEQTRRRSQRGMRNAAGSTVCQMHGGTVGAYLNSADLSGDGVDAKGNPLPGSNGYKQMITPSYMFGPEQAIHPWRAP